MVGYPPRLAESIKRKKTCTFQGENLHLLQQPPSRIEYHIQEKLPLCHPQLNHREHSIVQGIWVAGAFSQHRGSSAFVFAELALVHNLLVHARVTNWKPKWGCDLIGFILLVSTLQLNWALGNTQNKHIKILNLLACFSHSTDDLVKLDCNVWCEGATEFHLGWLMMWK